MIAENACLRCGGTHLVPAHVERPIAFCMDHATHHGILPLGLKASLCPDCGHVEFRVPDANPLRGPHEQGEAVVLQEEDF